MVGIATSEKGAVLITGLLLLALISVMATTAFILSTSEVGISENYKYEEQAFNNAEAGVQFGIVKLEAALDSGMALPSSGAIEITQDTAPEGFSFTLSPLSVSEDAVNSYQFSSTGTASKHAYAVIEVNVKRLPAICYGIFGDQAVDSKSNAYYYSYDSRLIPNPSPVDSSGNCDVSSNGSVSLQMNTFVDGDVALGKTDTVDATYKYSDVPIVTGEEPRRVGPIDTDPLKVDTDGFRWAFDAALAVNDNTDISPVLTDDKIYHPGGKVTLAGKYGGSTYYLEEIHLFTADELEVDAKNGPVTIYLRGIFIAESGSKICVLNTDAAHAVQLKMTEDPFHSISSSQTLVNLQNSSGINESGDPVGFSILTDSDGILDIQNGFVIKGLLYAPRAMVSVHNSSAFYGAIWAKRFEGQDGAVFYFDTALREAYLSNELGLTSWKRVQN